MSEAAKLFTVHSGDSQHERTVEIVEYLREVSVPIIGLVDDEWSDRASELMTALCVFAGSLLGTMIIADIATDKDKKRITDSMAKNFRAGIEAGKHRAMRVMTELDGSAMQ